jgi:PIN domain nuclease of toxin-antitoxin system
MIRLLLDTNALIWYFQGNPRMNSVKELIGSDESQVFISAISWWELAIKIRIGKLPAEFAALRPLAAAHDFQELPLLGRHTEVLQELPKIHNDPFDHMLIAQALTEPMRLITGDRILTGYSSLVMVV